MGKKTISRCQTAAFWKAQREREGQKSLPLLAIGVCKRPLGQENACPVSQPQIAAGRLGMGPHGRPCRAAVLLLDG